MSDDSAEGGILAQLYYDKYVIYFILAERLIWCI